MMRNLFLLALLCTLASCTGSRYSLSEFQKPATRIALLAEETGTRIQLSEINFSRKEKMLKSPVLLPVIKKLPSPYRHNSPYKLQADSTDSSKVDDSTASDTHPFKTGVYKGYDMFALSAPVLYVGSFVILIAGIALSELFPFSYPLYDIISGVTIVLFFLTFLGSYVASVIGLRRIKKSDHKLKGKWLALIPFLPLVAGFAVGTLSAILSFLLF